ncbi:hypothetical protein M427DRAFT_46887 [Gonapodya prolifera JEL478]|uniref:Protein kinase domain-containing protein n=1 Tax=Gonapodya prolifera (strain JEL478) TaxID=1344416 RepID=A0A139A5H2_GONPJ|nr:hypothetical protein M427DRAFT_46887 [Gonapodya prolifera JEL478]|eukprot:KXS11715.1 hypothetical protein M427DRAFT_46887 [Gonapodya prolifera JEL478]
MLMLRRLNGKSWNGNSTPNTFKSATSSWERGGYGNVYLGTLLIRRHPGAVKVLRSDVDVGDSGFIQEVTTWRLFRHTNVLELTGACISVARPFMVSPVMENGDFFN